VNFGATASSSSCDTPEFEYWLKLNGTWVIKRPFSLDPTWAWDTTGYALGTYQVVVWANQRGAPTSSPETSAVTSVTLIATYCVAVTDSASPPSPAMASMLVTITANASGCPNPNPVYEFWILAPGATAYTDAQPYSTSPTLSWPTTGLAPGVYRINVWARDASSPGLGSNSSGTWDTYNANLTYTLTAGCPAVSDVASPARTAMASMPVTITASASACPNPKYKFWVLAPGATAYTQGQDYSSNPTFNWNTTSLTPGTYRINVWTHDASDTGVYSNASGSWDAYNANLTYVLTAGCPGVTDSASPAAGAMPGVAVTVTASAPGCPAPQYEFWVLYPGASSYILGRGYDASPVFNWNTNTLALGAYRINVWVKDGAGVYSNSSGSWDAYNAGLVYNLIAGCSSVTDSASPPSPSAVGTTITITAVAAGCPNPQYEFWILAPGASSYSNLQPYSGTASASWLTGGLAPGTYRINVWVHDTSNSGLYKNASGGWDAYNATLLYTLS
jgi:hypothetical protein